MRILFHCCRQQQWSCSLSMAKYEERQGKMHLIRSRIWLWDSALVHYYVWMHSVAIENLQSDHSYTISVAFVVKNLFCLSCPFAHDVCELHFSKALQLKGVSFNILCAFEIQKSFSFLKFDIASLQTMLCTLQACACLIVLFSNVSRGVVLSGTIPV